MSMPRTLRAQEAKLSRRSFGRLAGGSAALPVVAAATAACVPSLGRPAGSYPAGEGPPAGAQGKNAWRPPQPVTLQWWPAGPAAQQEYYQSARDQFMKWNPNIRVDLTVTEGGQVVTKVITATAAGTPPDVFAGFSPGRLIANKVPADLTSYLNGPFGFDLGQITPEWVRDMGMKHDGKYYFMPREMAGDSLVYNKDLFQQARIPEPKIGSWTTDEFLEACQRVLTVMRKPGNDQDIWATSTLPPGTYWSFGAQGVSNDLKTITGSFNGPQAIAFYQWELDLIAKHRVMVGPAAQRATTLSPPQLVATGRLAIAVGGYTDVKSGVFRQQGVNVGITGEPKTPTGKAYHSMRLIMDSMSSQSKQPQAAWELLKYLAGPVGQEQRARALNQMPANQKAREAIGFYTDPDWKPVVELQKLPTGIIPAQVLLTGFEPVDSNLLDRMATDGVKQVLDSEATLRQNALNDALRQAGKL